MDLKEKAKELGIKSYWNKKEETLIKEIAEIENKEDGLKDTSELLESMKTEEVNEVLDKAIEKSKEYEYQKTSSLTSSDSMQSQGWEVYEMPLVNGVLIHKLRRKING